MSVGRLCLHKMLPVNEEVRMAMDGIKGGGLRVAVAAHIFKVEKAYHEARVVVIQLEFGLYRGRGKLSATCGDALGLHDFVCDTASTLTWPLTTRKGQPDGVNRAHRMPHEE